MKAVVLVAKTESSPTWKLDSKTYLFDTTKQARKFSKEEEKEKGFPSDWTIQVWTEKEIKEILIPSYIAKKKTYNDPYGIYLCSIILDAIGIDA